MPELSPFGINPRRSGPLAYSQAAVLVGAEEAPELGVIVSRQALEPAPEVTP